VASFLRALVKVWLAAKLMDGHMALKRSYPFDEFGLVAGFKLGERVVRKTKEGLVRGELNLDTDGNLKINE
jgi:hypothetical protein